MRGAMVSGWVMAGLAIFGLAPACAAEGLATPPAAESGPARLGEPVVPFYVPPAPLPQGEPGRVIRSQPLQGTMALPSAARNTLVLYHSLDPADRPVAVSGTVAVPKGTPPAGGWPVITWTHGTTGIAAACAPSLDTDNGPEHAYIADIRTLLDAAVARGFAVVATDYQGLGVPGFMPFFQGVPNAQNALDMLRAAREIEPAIGPSYAVMGHSQGGQADLFAAAYGASYAPELKLVGTVAMAPGANVMGRLDAVRASDKTELALPYLMYVLQSYAGSNPDVDVTRILTAPARAHLPDLYRGCMSAALSSGYWSRAIAKDQFLPDPDLSAFLVMAARNEPGTLNIPVPALILQGTADVTVRPQDTDGVARDLCARGAELTYVVLPGESHDGVMKAGADRALGFLADRFAGRPAGSDCAALPRAAP